MKGIAALLTRMVELLNSFDRLLIRAIAFLKSSDSSMANKAGSLKKIVATRRTEPLKSVDGSLARLTVPLNTAVLSQICIDVLKTRMVATEKGVVASLK